LLRRDRTSNRRRTPPLTRPRRSGTSRTRGCWSSQRDADPAADNFSLLKSLPPVDVALLPFWYSDESNRRFVNESIRPRQIVAMHVPPADAAKVRDALRAVNVEIAAVPGSLLNVGR
jgi:hypothetical protein